MNTKKTLPLVIVAIILTVAVIYFTRNGGNNNLSPSETQSVSPSISVSGSPLPSPSATDGQVTPRPSVKPSPSPVSYIIPKCWLGGKITFEGGVFKTNDAYFNYDQVTDKHDFIRWTITPAGENVSIGPNMFAGLEIPSGRDIITVGFNSGGPKYAEYKLKASIDYPVELPEGGKVLNAVCSGDTKLIIK